MKGKGTIQKSDVMDPFIYRRDKKKMTGGIEKGKERSEGKEKVRFFLGAKAC